MKRDNKLMYIAALLIAAVLFSFLTIYAFGEHRSSTFSVSAKSAVLYQPETDSFIYSKNANQRLPMASTTKIMTALVALENSDLCDIVEIDDSATNIEGSSAYLKKGDVLTMEELLYALLLQSANDAACAIACHVSGDIESFSILMNEKATNLGLTDTHFDNPHGLDSEEHYSTARDLALIAAEALKNNIFKTIVSTYQKSFTTEQRSRTYVNHNKLLRIYDGCIGIKTGYTKKSGRCLVGAAEKDGLTFISVTLDAPSDWNDHAALLNYGYEKLECVTLTEAFDHIYEIAVIDGVKSSLKVANINGASIITERGDYTIDKQTKLVRYAIAPINRGDILGEIIYTVDSEKIARVPLVATESISKKEKQGFIDKIFTLFD
ncbi:MAG: D-alanyl-D-alanine carboxypeptidase [Clostridia bacterium]|nr:D-alanyl-D-alanine carboxypeptidase [Clostridia bacterium]